MRYSKKTYPTRWSQHRLRAGHRPHEQKVRWFKRLAQWGGGWFRVKKPVLRFVILFGLLTGLLYAAALSGPFQRSLLPPYLHCSALIGSTVCNWFGQHTRAAEQTISSAQFSLGIGAPCGATEPLALFVAAVLAFPAPFRRKIPGLLLGLLILAALNLVRITSLFLVGVYFPKAFDWMHRDAWQAAFILAAIALWAAWIQWAMKPRPAMSHAPN